MDKFLNNRQVDGTYVTPTENVPQKLMEGDSTEHDTTVEEIEEISEDKTPQTERVERFKSVGCCSRPLQQQTCCMYLWMF